ncbi:sec-independent protein translocase protein TATA, chloroplastic-like [Cicer arietinum]|uniref:Sec-independent protein translocase protein TATA, chloroplastic-like n=1 Tax=Cicer arietinum TaxID=3827 RepID=A0A1S2XX12_CICAR|nr:sec-independent protein translocase protein TATA, chloroplastic-like [Cicer arietinum]
MEATLSLCCSSVIRRLPLSSSLSFLASKSNYNTSVVLKKARISSRRTKGFTCKAFFGLGVPELVVIAGVAALVFGPKKLPEVGRSIGKTVKSFQQAAKEFETELKKEPNSTEEIPVTSDQEEQDIKVSSTKEDSA